MKSIDVAMSEADLDRLRNIGAGEPGRGFSLSNEVTGQGAHYFARKCEFWRAHTNDEHVGVRKYASIAATAWCEVAEAGMPTPRKTEGSGWTLSYDLVTEEADSPRQRLGTDGANGHPITIVLVGPEDAEAMIMLPGKGRNSCFVGQSPSLHDGQPEVFNLPKREEGYVVAVHKNRRAFAIHVQAIPPTLQATIGVTDTGLLDEPSLQGVFAKGCKDEIAMQIAERARSAEYEAEDAARTQTRAPEPSQHGQRSEGCPDDWTPLDRGLCYDVGGVAFVGNVTVITLRVWSPTDVPLSSARLVVHEDGEEICDDQFGLNNLRAKTIAEVKTPCGISQQIRDLDRLRVLLTLQ